MSTEVMNLRVARIVGKITEAHPKIDKNGVFTSVIYRPPLENCTPATDFKVTTSLESAVRTLLTLLTQNHGHVGRITTDKSRKVVYSTYQK